MQFTNLTRENIVALYRYALLLTGVPRLAGSLLVETLGGGASQISQFRNNRGSLAFALKKLRENCLRVPPGGGKSMPEELLQESENGDDPLFFAWRFSALPEPQRSALALLYLRVFTPPETADLLGLSLANFSETLTSARLLLGERQIVPKGREGRTA